MYFGIRFDFRNPELAATTMADRYRAVLDMAQWADRLGCAGITISEHHASPDGYLPSPLIMVAAMVACTEQVRLRIAALIAPFYDPIRLAEDLLVLDHLSKGRVDLVVAGGYVEEEFALYGVSTSERARRVTEVVETLRGAFTGMPFEYRGRTVHLTPGPFGSGGISITLGGSSEAAARRAARLADDFIPSEPAVWDFYRDERLRLEKADPGPCLIPPNLVTAFARDPEAGWAEMAPFFLHEMNAYGTWQAQTGVASPYRPTADTDALRTTGRYRVVTPEAFVEEQRASPFPFALLHPMCGGMPIELAWSSLRLFEEEVLPAFPG